MVLLLTSIVSPDESTVIAKFGSYKESATLLMIRQTTASSVISASLANIECYFLEEQLAFMVHDHNTISA